MIFITDPLFEAVGSVGLFLFAGGIGILGKINLPGGCVKCSLRALIEGQLSALASLAKTEKCLLWQKFLLLFSPKFVYYFYLEGLSVFIIINLAIL